MASIEEKTPAPPPETHLKGPQITSKASRDTISSNTLTPSASHLRRPSDASNSYSQHGDPFDTDVEAIISPSTTTGERCGRKSLSNWQKGATDCQVWPGQDHWKRKAKAAKAKRSCTCLSHLSKRNRLIVKILIGVLIVGIAVGVGFGVSKPLGAGIWQPHDS